MKSLYLTLGLLALALCSVSRAQDDNGQNLAQSPDEIVTDFGIDEYLAIPTSNLKIGAHMLRGAKTSFSGSGFLSSFQPGSDFTTPALARIYNDGNVLLDKQPYTFTTSNSDGTTTTHTAGPTPAGTTNSWSFLDLNQIRPDGNMDFHSYSANVPDTGTQNPSVNNGGGIELMLSRDMGKIGKRMEWKLNLGVSLTDLKAKTDSSSSATITTLTDTYVPNLNGGTSLPTSVPYTAPSFKQIPSVDANGNPVYDSTGTQIIDYVETTIYMGNVPLNRTITTSTGVISNHWELKGAYFTFKIGPSISYLVTDRLRLTFGAGASIVLSGATFDVTSTFQPDVGGALTSDDTSDLLKFLPGYYAEAELQYDFSDKAGFYAGVEYQDNGSYTQTSNLNDIYTGSSASYKALINLSSLEGFRMGLTFKF